MEEISLKQFQLEIFLCYYLQYDIPSVPVNRRTELILDNIALACCLNHIVNTTNLDEYIPLSKLKV